MRSGQPALRPAAQTQSAFSGAPVLDDLHAVISELATSSSWPSFWDLAFTKSSNKTLKLPLSWHTSLPASCVGFGTSPNQKLVEALTLQAGIAPRRIARLGWREFPALCRPAAPIRVAPGVLHLDIVSRGLFGLADNIHVTAALVSCFADQRGRVHRA